MNKDYKRGAQAAAAVADDYATTHEFRLGDCILGKLNLRNGKPRRNRRRVLSPAVAEARGMTKGLALALAEVHRHVLGDISQVVREVARDAGLTLEECRRAGVDPHDWKELRKAGVK